jgi:MFS transporter, AAHS family, 4-hydroxybenzoate transporter
MTPGGVSVTELMEGYPLTRFQIRVVALCASVAFLDGFDTQAIGYAAPGIAALLKLRMSEFGPVFSIGLVGALLGTLSFGPLADRYGRKWLLVAASLVFGTATLLTAQATSFQALIIFRLIAGFGLGGATPNFIALGAEYAPQKVRGTLVTLLFSAFPLGGMVGGLTSSYIIPRFGWRALFYIGGLLPFVVAILLVMALPESWRFLLVRGSNIAEVRRIMRRIAPGVIGPDTELIATGEMSARGLPIKRLFTEGRAVPTLLLWVPFFASFMILSTVVLWAPSLLSGAGISVGTSGVIVALYNFGSVIGNASSGWLIDRLGAYKSMTAALVLGSVSLGTLGQVTFSPALMGVAISLSGFFIGGASAGLLAVAAIMYPTAMRSTGVGCAMGMARAGQILGPLAGGAMLANHWSLPGVFLAAAIPCLCGAAALVFLGLGEASRRTAARRTRAIPVV